MNTTTTIQSTTDRNREISAKIASLKRLIAKGERELKQLEDEVETAKSTVSAVNSGGN